MAALITGVGIEGRRAWFDTIEAMQRVLDRYLVADDTKRPHQGRGMNGRTAANALIEAMGKEARRTCSPTRKPPDLRPPRRRC